MGPVQWNSPVPTNFPGVYIVSITNDPMVLRNINQPPIDKQAIEKWILKVQHLTLDGMRPDLYLLANRISMFWLPDETIIYIGKAGTSLKARINQYYNTELGERRPHAGGHWIKTLSILTELNVFWCPCENPEDMEEKLLDHFLKNISKETLSSLYDPQHPFPFANLEFPKGNRKKHGISGSVLK
jgi:hypothetical protein